MEILRTPERRREPRTRTDLALTVWGVDARGERFLQKAHAREISLSGALLFGLDTELRSGDVIGILYVGRKARYRVVWVGHSGAPRMVQAAVHRFASDECPWKDLLMAEPVNAEPAGADRPGKPVCSVDIGNCSTPPTPSLR